MQTATLHPLLHPRPSTLRGDRKVLNENMSQSLILIGEINVTSEVMLDALRPPRARRQGVADQAAQKCVAEGEDAVAYLLHTSAPLLDTRTQMSTFFSSKAQKMYVPKAILTSRRG